MRRELVWSLKKTEGRERGVSVDAKGERTQSET